MAVSYFSYKVFFRDGLTSEKTFSYLQSCLKGAFIISFDRDVDKVYVYDNYDFICYFKHGVVNFNDEVKND
jgi:hypothetical protein